MTKDDIIRNDLKDDDEKKPSELEECKNKRDEYLNNWKRERADFINYKKDEMEKIGFLGKYVKEDIIFKILPIIDNIYLAATAVGGVPPEGGKKQDLDPWVQGFLQIQNQILDFLKKEGIEEIKTIGEKFDPNLMEVIEEVGEGPSSAETGVVVEEVQRGYTMDDKVIRPAKVKISK